MISLPIVSTGITFTEIPDNIAYFMEIGNCTQKCKGCHSPHLQGDTVEHTLLKDIINDCIKAKQQGATAILLLGGTTNGIPINTLNLIIKELSFILPVGVYSGAPVDSVYHKYLFDNSMLKWLKVGDYDSAKGGLDKPTTNQRFYERDDRMEVIVDSNYLIEDVHYKLHDITHKFWK